MSPGPPLFHSFYLYPSREHFQILKNPTLKREDSSINRAFDPFSRYNLMFPERYLYSCGRVGVPDSALERKKMKMQ